MKGADGFLNIFSIPIRQILKKIPAELSGLQEIRLRINGPLLLRYRGREYAVSENGRLISTEGRDPAQAHMDGPVHYCTKKELQETMEYLSGYSLYAYEDELRQGFLTIPGGHRVGVAGKMILEQGRIRSIRYISFLNVRLSHQVKGCADSVLPYVTEEGEICNTLIISPPCCGKTTLLRDMVRQISNGTDYCRGKTVGVVDERSEIGGAYQGLPQNDLGIRTDLLDCCPKAEGMMLLIRAMAPQVVAVDEIGDYRDIEAMESVLHCGCRLIATVHGNSVEDIRRKPLLQKLMLEHVFGRYIVLDAKKQTGSIQGIYDAAGMRLDGEEAALC